MKHWALAALPVLLCPGIATAKFAPVEGRTYRYTLVEQHAAGRFTTERRIVFRRAPQGWTADLIVTAADATGDRDVAAMSRRVIGAMIGRTIRYRLDDRGAVVAVEDQDELMRLVAQSFASMAGKGASAKRGAVADRTAKALAALPPDQQRALLASFLSPVIGGALADAQPGERPVTQKAGSAAGSATAELAGSEKVVRANGRIVSDTDVAGPTLDASAAMRIVQHREIDPATGIVLVNDRRTETWLTATPDKRQVVISAGRVDF